MKKYNVTIEETVVGQFEVIASSKEDAINIARDKYRKCEFVNEPGDLVDKKFYIMDEG